MTPSDIQKSISEIRNTIASNDLSEAVEKLIQLTNTLQKEEAHEEAITISANFNQLEKDIRQFLLDSNQISLQRNRLMDQMLDLLDVIEEPESTASTRPQTTTKEKQITYTSTGDGGGTKRWLYGGIAIIALAFTAYMGYNAAKKDSSAVNDKLCLKYLQDARDAFDQGIYENALKLYTNAKNHCIDSKEASERIKECKRLMAGVTPSVAQQSAGTTKATNPQAADVNKEIPANATADSETAQKIAPESPGASTSNRQLVGFVHSMSRTDVQGMRGSARLNKNMLNSKLRIPFVSNPCDTPAKETNPTAVWFNGNHWRIYHPGQEKFQPKQKYNVLVFDQSDKGLSQHDVTSSNAQANETILSGQYPASAILFVMPAYTGESISRNAHPIAVHQKGGQWRILNMDRQKMLPGARFYVYQTNKNAFVHQAMASNSRKDGTLLDHPLTNGQADKILFVTQHWGGQGTYNPSEIGLNYSSSTRKWVIRNQDGSPIPEGAKFNVLVAKTN